jgi:hypothetical protein
MRWLNNKNGKSSMPPKSPVLPDIIFVSDELSGAMFHHTKVDDIADLLVEHIKLRGVLGHIPNDIPEDTSHWIYQFAMMQIDCDANLKFVKKRIIYHPELLYRFLQTFQTTLTENLLDENVLEVSIRLPNILQTLREALKREMEKSIENVF